ncbi:MAG: class I SAM-dependent methyltransferase [Acutalibacteraceae bacterium]|nr:class I SAM-dependent methyltransferase [Acutalibacteraceae bacterium]
MSKIKLDNRLSAVASLVRQGSVVADIGTDHAYLLCYLIENGVCSEGIAADINKGPLNNAKQTVIDCGINDKVQLILSDGLKSIPENSADDIVMAGMGGILISEIIDCAPWVKNENINIIAQPMTHAEVLREYLCKNGFKINKEITATDGKRLYVVMSLSYSGLTYDYDKSYYYLGELLKNNDEITKKYIEKMISMLQKKYVAQKKAEIEGSQELEKLINDIKKKFTEVYGI